MKPAQNDFTLQNRDRIEYAENIYVGKQSRNMRPAQNDVPFSDGIGLVVPFFLPRKKQD